MTYEYTPDERIIGLMGLVVNAMRRLADAKLKAIGLTFPQYGTLFALLSDKNIDLSQRELADVMNTDTTTIMVICDALEKKGLLTREPDSSDRRVNRVAITKKGRGIVDDGLPSIREVFDPVLSSITKKESMALSSILDKMRRVASALESEKADSAKERP
jgi:MarR family transcriptional regulator for hemolysin